MKIAGIELALAAAIVSTASLHGEAQTRLDAGHLPNEKNYSRRNPPPWNA